MGVDVVAMRRGLAAEARHRRSCGAAVAQHRNKAGDERVVNKNYKERVIGREPGNKGEEDNTENKTDIIDVEGVLDFAYFYENRRREGELDGNTVYWEYKKG